jgi:hypothetical protein
MKLANAKPRFYEKIINSANECRSCYPGYGTLTHKEAQNSPNTVWPTQLVLIWIPNNEVLWTRWSGCQEYLYLHPTIYEHDSISCSFCTFGNGEKGI